jgi:hypothetical protein
MSTDLSGHVTAFFLYDVADAIDLSAVATLVGPTARVRLTPKATTPSYVQYQQPPLTIDGAAIGLDDACGFTVRFKPFDYGVISVALTALVDARGDDIVRILRGEREALSHQERDEVLRQRISYFEHDLLVPTWNAAFVYDSESGALAASEIVEFVNSQLLEFRYYDQLLARELARLYAELQKPSWFKGWGGRRYTRAAQQVHALFIDVNDLTDRAESALRVAGDIYTARVLTLTGSRLGLEQWKADVREKLNTLDAIYRFAVEQTGMARGEALELLVVLILVVELVLFFMGLMK